MVTEHWPLTNPKSKAKKERSSFVRFNFRDRRGAIKHLYDHGRELVAMDHNFKRPMVYLVRPWNNSAFIGTLNGFSITEARILHSTVTPKVKTLCISTLATKSFSKGKFRLLMWGRTCTNMQLYRSILLASSYTDPPLLSTSFSSTSTAGATRVSRGPHMSP